MRIALAGNPNSGKTTMYNALTGRNEKVGNWAGVTVERKESPIRKGYCEGNEELVAVDLPGAYSMSPFTSEESITSSYVKNEAPDAIINIVDATNLSRSLFFTTQLLELGIPVVVALNKSDVTEKKKTEIDIELLSKKLGCPVIRTVASSSGHKGLKEAVTNAAALKGKGQKAPYMQEEINLQNKAAVEAADRKRFDFVNGIVKAVEKRKVFTKNKNSQDQIDAVLTNKIVGIPIFAAVMGLTKAAALAYLMFNLFTPPCFAALGVMNSEMQDRKWLWGGIALQLGTGYAVAFMVYQTGTLITTGSLGSGVVPGLAAVAAMVLVVVFLVRRTRKNFSTEYGLHAQG